MFMFNITLTLIGIIFFMFGFVVTFKKKYNLVTVFIKNKASARYTDTYAEQIGLIALMSGMLYIFAGIVGFVSSSIFVSFLMFSVCVALTASLTVISSIKAGKA